MTTFDTVPTIPQFLVWKLTQRKEKTKTANRERTWVVNLLRVLFHLGGLGCLTIAGFSWNMTAGYVVAGLSFFILSWLTTSGRPIADEDNRPHQTRR